jgi:hypothetical protein
MNASAEKSRPCADRRERPAAVILALMVLGGGQLAGCADIHRASFLPPVNPESPVAGAVATASMQNFKRPSFASVPPKPLNIPPAGVVKTAVIDMVRCRRAYEAWAAAHPAQVSATSGFAESLRAELDNNPNDRPTPEQTAAIEAEAAKLRAYTNPPPPMHPGPSLSASQAAPPTARSATAPMPQPVTSAKAAPAPAPRTVAPRAPTPTTQASVPAPPPQRVAAVQPLMTPIYSDPLLAHCQ